MANMKFVSPSIAFSCNCRLARGILSRRVSVVEPQVSGKIAFCQLQFILILILAPKIGHFQPFDRISSFPEE